MYFQTKRIDPYDFPRKTRNLQGYQQQQQQLYFSDKHYYIFNNIYVYKVYYISRPKPRNKPFC